jgi:hypothetical protein
MVAAGSTLLIDPTGSLAITAGANARLKNRHEIKP